MARMGQNDKSGLPPEGAEWIETNLAVKRSIDAACGGGVPVQKAAEAAFDALIERLASTIGEHDALELVQRWAGQYEDIVGEGAFGPVFRDASEE